SPTDPLLSITTKFARERSSTFKQTLRQLRPGAPLKLAEPMGDFVLPKDTTIPIVYVAGGIGITPMHSMVKFLLDSGEHRDIHLIYAVTHLEEAAFLPLFKQYGLQLTLVVAEPPAEYKGETGSLNADRILQLAGDDGKSLLYLAGPEPMVERFTKDLRA